MNNIFMSSRQRKTRGGFTLIEVLIALAVFSIVAAAAFSLFSSHQALFSQEQDIVRLSMDLRNALAQIQIDLSNAGTGVFPGANVPNWPIGVTIVNSNPGANCYNVGTQTYSANCFDTMHVVAADAATPPLRPEDLAATCVSMANSNMYALPATGLTAAQTAALYRSGDQLLIVKGDGSQLSSVVMTGDASVAGAKVLLPHTTVALGTGIGTDPLEITTHANPKLGVTFCNTDWVVKLRAVSYSVDVATDPANPRLQRIQSGVTDVVTDQIVGFKVGVSLWNQVLGTSSEAYNFNAGNYGFDFTLIRSIRILMVGRTRPNFETSYKFRNAFDNGPYQIQPVSLVVNPRNLSLKD
jgi:prepilin-type N-terminal cleavage/methylation domain-containing protein